MTNPPFEISGHDRPSPWMVICDHASNHVPNDVGGGDLGLEAADMGRHIAFDIGARGLALALAERLNGPMVASNFSRLVIDPNRGEADPTLVMRLYDGTLIPANRHVDGVEIARRRDAYYRPYHHAVAEMAARHPNTTVVSVHSFTAQLRGRAPRPWHIGLLTGKDRRLTEPLLQSFGAEPDLVVGDNEPYVGYFPGDSIDRHCTPQGRLNTLIELRNDLIETPQAQAAWAERLVPHLEAARTKAMS